MPTAIFPPRPRSNWTKRCCLLNGVARWAEVGAARADTTAERETYLATLADTVYPLHGAGERLERTVGGAGAAIAGATGRGCNGSKKI